jgi:hypothetical protein
LGTDLVTYEKILNTSTDVTGERSSLGDEVLLELVIVQQRREWNAGLDVLCAAHRAERRGRRHIVDFKNPQRAELRAAHQKKSGCTLHHTSSRRKRVRRIANLV